MKKLIKESELRNLIKESIKKYLLHKDSKAKTYKENVMERFCGITSNGHKPMMVEKITIDRIVNKHGNNGYIIVSANRSDESDEWNTEHGQKLYNDIKKSGYSFLPVYGGYRGTDGVEDDFEPSFIVFNYNKKGETQDFSILYQLALKWCLEHKQDSVTIKAPDMPPMHINANGEKVNSREGFEYWKNDPEQMFFTSLKPRDEIDPQNPSRRFTLDIGYDDNDSEEFDEYYINPSPCTLNERMRRGNEIMLV